MWEESESSLDPIITISTTSWAGQMAKSLLNETDPEWREIKSMDLIRANPYMQDSGIIGESKYNELLLKIVGEYKFEFGFFQGFETFNVPDCMFTGDTINLENDNEIINLLLYFKLEHKKQKQNCLEDFYESLRNFDFEKSFQNGPAVMDLQKVEYLNSLYLAQQSEISFIFLLLVYMFYKYDDNYSLVSVPKITINYDFIWTSHKNDKTGVLWYIDDPSILLVDIPQSKGIYFVLKQENNMYKIQKIQNQATLLKLIEMHKISHTFENIPY